MNEEEQDEEASGTWYEKYAATYNTMTRVRSGLTSPSWIDPSYHRVVLLLLLVVVPIDIVAVVAACIIGRCHTGILLLVVVPSSIDIMGRCCSSIDIMGRCCCLTVVSCYYYY